MHRELGLAGLTNQFNKLGLSSFEVDVRMSYTAGEGVEEMKSLSKSVIEHVCVETFWCMPKMSLNMFV